MRFIRSSKSKRRGFIQIRGRGPNSKIAYEGRDKVLFRMGFASYREYLKSDLWAAVRTAVLSAQPLCEICNAPASCLHHLSYRVLCLKGKCPYHLVSLCSQCHHRIEFCHDGKKRSFEAANKQVKKLLRKTGNWTRHTRRGQSSE